MVGGKSMSACVSACLHVSKTTCPNFTKFTAHITMAETQSSFVNSK